MSGGLGEPSKNVLHKTYDGDNRKHEKYVQTFSLSPALP